ncbi:plastocyanin/azurin family copper-binding protein [Olivibacter sitiensis]|uniref:plastocyanin/azurin family copper-binding protein n=1 Tax=Olivibacter sitiensis TaxID=376470 RepID=UPI0003F8C8DB|nr:azurin [Olivibacter sitiensis]
MKKVFYTASAVAVLFMAACGGGSSSSSTTTTTETSAPAEEAPEVSESDVTDHIIIEGGDNMQFDKTLFAVKAGEKIKLTLKNVGELPKESMGHNVVVLKPGTDVASFGGAAVQAAATEYIPEAQAGNVIAHTKLLGPGESDEIEITLPSKGTYEFICSFPGHFGSMRGKIVAL